MSLVGWGSNLLGSRVSATWVALVVSDVMGLGKKVLGLLLHLVQGYGSG
jgi:hypothetical protein